MYQQETITKELHLQLSDEDLAQFELDAKETERLGHIGTHMDCYMEAPRYKEYVTDAVVVDCRNGLPADEYFNNLDIEGKHWFYIPAIWQPTTMQPKTSLCLT